MTENDTLLKFNYNPEPLKAGDSGHSFVYGWFIIDENLKSVYLDFNNEEYDRLMKKYNK